VSETRRQKWSRRFSGQHPLSRRGCYTSTLEHELTIARIDQDGVPVMEFSAEQAHCHWLHDCFFPQPHGQPFDQPAKLSPIRLTKQMADTEIDRLYHAVRESLTEWVERLRKERGTGFPEKVTAFRPDMAVHGKYRKPCPVCGSPVQRIVHAENETNYCATCQTGGKLLADRSLSRLLKDDWPRSLEEMEEIKKARV